MDFLGEDLFRASRAPDLRYNLSFLVDDSVEIGHPIIVVSVNYRLSAWGFLSSDETV